MSSSLQGRDGYDDNNVDWMDVNNGDDHDSDGEDDYNHDNNDNADNDSQDDCGHGRGGSRQENSRREVNCAGENTKIHEDTKSSKT